MLRRLWAVAHEVNIDSESLHERVYNEFGVDSLKELDNAQGWYIIDVLQGKNVRRPPAGKGMITDRQIYMIRMMERELGWNDNPGRLAGFIKKYAGVEHIEWLSRRKASAVIEGMKRLIRNSECGVRN